MAKDSIVHARLDQETRRLLDRLRRRTGLQDSELIRRALRAFYAAQPVDRPPRIIGLGRFRSGVPDLGENKKHLGGFGGS